MASMTEADRELLERTLDAFATATSAHEYAEALRLYEQAAPIVRQRPDGSRRLRSDFNRRRRPVAQLELPT